MESQLKTNYSLIETIKCNSNLEMTLRNYSQGIIRKTPFLTWRRECTDYNNKEFLVDKIQFKGIANPYLPLLAVFQELIDTQRILCRQLIQFMQKAVAIYKIYKQQNVLKEQFFGTQQSSKNAEKRQAMQFFDQMLKNTQKNNSQIKYNPQSFPSAFQFLKCNKKGQFKKNQLLQFKAKCQKKLKLYSIIPRSVKIARLRELAKKLKPNFFTQISLENNTVSLKLKSKASTHLFAEIVPLQMILQSTDIIYGLDQQQVQNSSQRLLQNIQNFHECTEQFYKEKNAQAKRAINNYNSSLNRKLSPIKQMLTNGQYGTERGMQELNESCLTLTPHNVIFELQKIIVEKQLSIQDLRQKQQDSTFRIQSLKSQSRIKKFRIIPHSCSIDISIYFLQELGINFGLPGEQSKIGPCSIRDQILYYYPLPPLNTFNFLPCVQKLQSETNLKDIRVNEIVSVLSWLCVVSAISQLQHKKQNELLLNKQSNNQKSIYEQEIDSQKVFEIIRNKNEQMLLGKHIKVWLLMFQMETDQSQPVLQFQYSNWFNFFNESSQGTTCDFQTHKYDKAKLLFQTCNQLYYGQQNFKFIAQKQSFFSGKKNIERYLVLFMLAKFIQLTFTELILKMYNNIDDFRSQKYHLKNLIDRHETIFTKVRDKISKDYATRISANDPNKFYFNEEIIFKNGFYNRLINFKFEDITKQGQENINKFMQEIKQLKEGSKKWIVKFVKPFVEKQKQKTKITENQIIFRKNLIQLQIIFVINQDNYCDMKRIEAELQKMKYIFANQTYLVSKKLTQFEKDKIQEIQSLTKTKCQIFT